MAKQRSRTAAEVVRELENDPEYQAGIRARAAQAEELARLCAADESQLVAELQAEGAAVTSVWDFVASGGAPAGAVATLVAHLWRPHHPRIWEGIVRALATKTARAGALDALHKLYSSETDSGRRWVIANSIGSMARLTEVRDLPDISQYRALFRQSRKPAHVPPAI